MSGILRRLFGGGSSEAGPGTTPADPAEVEAAERAHELEVLRAEQGRLDELRQRQLRYAQYAWTPPAEGGEQRADDADRTSRDGGDEVE